MSLAITTKNTHKNKQTNVWKACLIWGPMLLCMALSYLYWLSVRGRSYEDLHGVFPAFFWCVLVVLHGSLGLVAMILAWQERTRLLYRLVYIYFLGALLIHVWVFLDYTNLDGRFYAYYQSLIHPDDVALHHELNSNPIKYEAINRLLKKGANADSQRRTWAIWKAHRQNNYPVMQLLLENGAKPDRPSRHRGVSFRIDGPLERILLRRDRSTTLLCEIVDRQDVRATDESLEFVRHLLIAGADPQQICRLQHRPLSILSLAIIRNNLDVLRMLNEFGAPIFLDQDGELVSQRIWKAANQGNQEMVDFLLEKLPAEEASSVFPEALTQAVLGGHTDSALNLLKAGAKPEREDFIALSIEKCDGNRNLVRELVAAGQDPNIENSHEQTPLVLAFKRKDLPLLNELIAVGADVNRANVRFGLLHHIFRMEPDLRIPFAEHLIAAGANLERRDSDDYTFLMRAAYRKDIDLVRLALDNGADLQAVTPGLELTAAKLAQKRNANDELLALLGVAEQPNLTGSNLIYEVKYKPVKIVVPSIQPEIDIHPENDQVMNALEAATRQNREEVYRELLELGANPNLMIKDGSPLIETNSQAVSTQINRLRALTNSDDPAIPILTAAALAGNIEVMDALLAAGADPNARAASGDTALHLVAIAGSITGQHQVDTTKLLVQSGANINDLNSEGYTPITLAARHHALAMIETLVSLKADLNVPDAQSRTVLGLTLRNGSIHEHVEALLRLGARPTQDDLTFARSQSSPELVSILEVAVN